MSFSIKVNLPQNIIKAYFDGLVKVEEAKSGNYKQSVETKPVEIKTVETKPVETKPVEIKPIEIKPVETKPVEIKPVEDKLITIVFGKNKLSKWVYSLEEYKLINKHGYVEHLCSKIDGIIVEEDNIISDDNINYTYKFRNSYLILNKEDNPGKTIDNFLDEDAKIINDFNKEYIKKCEIKIQFGNKSILILSKIEFPNINNEFINEVKDMLNDESKKYIGEKQRLGSSTHIIPYNKYSCIIIDYDDFLGLKYDEIDRMGRDLFYKIEHMYDKSKPLRTTEKVNKEIITNAFIDMTKNIVDNVENNNYDFAELLSTFTDEKNKGILNLTEKLLCGEIKIEEILSVGESAIKNMDNNESNKK